MSNIEHLADVLKKSNIPAFKSIEVNTYNGLRFAVVILDDVLGRGDEIELIFMLNQETGNLVFGAKGIWAFGENADDRAFQAQKMGSLTLLNLRGDIPFGYYVWDPKNNALEVRGALPGTIDDKSMIWAVRSLTHLCYLGKLCLVELCEIQTAVADGTMTEEEASSLRDQRNCRLSELIERDKGL